MFLRDYYGCFVTGFYWGVGDGAKRGAVNPSTTCEMAVCKGTDSKGISGSGASDAF